MPPRRRPLLHATLLLASWPLAREAAAQRAKENVVTAAKDAFGTSIGHEEIGLYSSKEVRGFSPLDAGNVRLDGFWFDQQGSINARLVQGSTVHVGLTAQGYPFPAPTGIVDYELRKPEDTLVVSVLTGYGPFGGFFGEVDAKIPIVADRFGVAAGVSYEHEEYYDGSDARVASLAVTPRWRPAAGIEVVPFFSLTVSRDEQVAPYVVTAGPYLPPRFPRRRFYGQDWAVLDANVSNSGVQARAQIGQRWELAGSVFHARRVAPIDHSLLFQPTLADGTTTENVIADPLQRRASTGAELWGAWSAIEGPRLHVLRARTLGRVRESAFGGGSAPVDLGMRTIGVPTAVPEPAFVLGRRTRDHVRQGTVGLAYEGRWKSVGELTAGVQKTYYEKEVEVPGVAATRTTASPWLAHTSLAVHLLETLALYGAYTRGLEESGIAPGSVVNRNAVLPAIVTQQYEAGLRYALTPDIRLVAGLFELQKPYFNIDGANVFTELGRIRNRGLELSFTGALFEHLTWVAGAVLTRPRVEGEAVTLGRVGPRPVGQTHRVVRANVFYTLPYVAGLSFDVGVLHTGERTASTSNQLDAPAVTTLDVGGRYQFTLYERGTTLRAQVTNVTNAYGWLVVASQSFRTNSPRTFMVSVAIDI